MSGLQALDALRERERGGPDTTSHSRRARGLFDERLALVLAKIQECASGGPPAPSPAVRASPEAAAASADVPDAASVAAADATFDWAARYAPEGPGRGATEATSFLFIDIIITTTTTTTTTNATATNNDHNDKKGLPAVRGAGLRGAAAQPRARAGRRSRCAGLMKLHRFTFKLIRFNLTYS